MDEITLAGLPGIAAAGGRHEHPLVFLHGAWDDHHGFGGYVEWFAARGWDTYAFSRRGRLGVPPDRCVGVRVEDYVEDTLAALAEIPGRPIVVGHSLGGLLAQVVAEQGKCAAAVLIEPGPPRGIPVLPKARTMGVFLKLTPRIAFGRPFLPSFRGFRRAWLNRLPADQAAALHARLVPESGRAFRQVLTGYRVDAAKVTCPVLCVSGLDSPAITPAMVAKVARRYRGTLLEFDGHSHWLMVEPGWEVVAEAIERWLVEVEPGLRPATPVRNGR